MAEQSVTPEPKSESQLTLAASLAEWGRTLINLNEKFDVIVKRLDTIEEEIRWMGRELHEQAVRVETFDHSIYRQDEIIEAQNRLIEGQDKLIEALGERFKDLKTGLGDTVELRVLRELDKRNLR